MQVRPRSQQFRSDFSESNTKIQSKIFLKTQTPNKPAFVRYPFHLVQSIVLELKAPFHTIVRNLRQKARNFGEKREIR